MKIEWFELINKISEYTGVAVPKAIQKNFIKKSKAQ